MAALLLLCLPLAGLAFAAPATTVSSAFPTVTPVQVGKGTCQYFANYLAQPGTDMTQPFVFHPTQAENSTANDLFTSITPGGNAAGLGARVVAALLAGEAKVLYTCKNGVVQNNFDGITPKTIFFSKDEGYRALTYLNEGLSLETYQHKGADGIFIGHGGSTTWAFRFLPSFIPQPSPYARDYFGMRLLPVGEKLEDGEFRSFIKMGTL